MFKKGWKQADAIVIVARNFVSTADGVAGQDAKSELVLEVHPEGEEPFRAEAKISFLGFSMKQRRMTPPAVGETIRVEYDPKSHDVKVLPDEKHDRKAIKKQTADDFQSALDAPIGSAPPMRTDVANALRAAGLGDVVDGGTITPDAQCGTVLSGPPRIVVQSGAEPPVEVPLHAMDPSLGGAAGILANGLPCRATVLAVVPLAGQKTSTGEDATGLVLTVTIAGQPPHQAQTGMYVPPAALGRLAPGSELVGKAVVGNNDAIAIDWNAFISTQ
jgi:hypothetical protein